MNANLRLWTVPVVLLIVTGGVHSQDMGPQSPFVLTKNASFRLPIRMAERERANLKELKLYMKSGEAPWSCIESADPDQKYFVFRAPRDGEYSFHIATVDLAERMVPANPEREPPAIVVVVDTTPPQVTVRTQSLPTGQPALRCRIEDANPDEKSLRVELATPTGWRLLSADSANPGFFPVVDAAALSGKVRVRAADRAGNTMEKEIDVAATEPESVVRRKANAGLTVIERTDPALARAEYRQPASVAAAAVPLLNSRKLTMDYHVRPANSDHGVEVWLSADGGKSWLSGGKGRRAQGAVAVVFPADGVFGYRIGITAENAPDMAPAPGAAPEGSIEIDTSAPELSVLAATCEVTDSGPRIRVRWHARDKNLVHDAVSLFSAATHGSDWTPVAAQLADHGTYVWPVPNGVGAYVHLKLAVRDRAGNETNREFGVAIQQEGSKPRVSLTGWRTTP